MQLWGGRVCVLVIIATSGCRKRLWLWGMFKCMEGRFRRGVRVEEDWNGKAICKR